MCFFEQTRWACGSWAWGTFREQCNKEHRIGETCGLKLVYSTRLDPRPCKICDQVAAKQRRIDATAAKIPRWHREGNRAATIERALADVADLRAAIADLRARHNDASLVPQSGAGAGGGRASGRQKRRMASLAVQQPAAPAGWAAAATAAAAAFRGGSATPSSSDDDGLVQHMAWTGRPAAAAAATARGEELDTKLPEILWKYVQDCEFDEGRRQQQQAWLPAQGSGGGYRCESPAGMQPYGSGSGTNTSPYAYA